MRIQNTLWATMLLAMGMLVIGCTPLISRPGSGTVIREERTVSDFAAVDICCGMHLELTQGAETAVTLEGDEAILAEIETIVRRDQLTVRFRPQFNLLPRFNSRQVVVSITTPEIRAVELSGGSHGETERLQTDELRVTLSGGSELAITELNAEQLDAALSGGAELSIESGVVTEQRVDGSGGSGYLTADVRSQEVDLDLSGGSQADVWVSRSLRVDASGGSEVTYRGSPTVNQNSSGGSRVRSVGE